MRFALVGIKKYIDGRIYNMMHDKNKNNELNLIVRFIHVLCDFGILVWEKSFAKTKEPCDMHYYHVLLLHIDTHFNRESDLPYTTSTEIR